MPAGSGPRPRHVPVRTCIACREPDSKRQLVRVVRTPGQHLAVDPTGRAPGRGAYICRQRECWVKALKGGTIPRALRFSPPADDLEALRAFGASMPPGESETT